MVGILFDVIYVCIYIYIYIYIYLFINDYRYDRKLLSDFQSQLYGRSERLEKALIT